MSKSYRVIPNWTHWYRAFVWWGWGPEPTIYVPAKRLPSPGWVQRTLAHERVHVAQWQKYGRLGFLRRYFLSRKWRLELEAEAFAASVRAGGASLDYYAGVLARSYRLRYSTETCAAAIRRWIGGGV